MRTLEMGGMIKTVVASEVEAESVLEPLYVAERECDPESRMVVVEAVPEWLTVSVANATVPSRNVTVPRVTETPALATTTARVIGVPCATRKLASGEVSPTDIG